MQITRTFSLTLSPAASFTYPGGDGFAAAAMPARVHRVLRPFKTKAEAAAYEIGLKDAYHMLGEALCKMKGDLS